MDDPDGLAQHPDLAAAGAAMRAAWREDQEAATRDAAEDWAHRQTLSDRLRAHMHRGDVLAVTVAGTHFVGLVEEVGGDLLAVRTPTGRVDIHLAPTVPLLVEVATRAIEGGHRGTDAAGGRFIQALRAREPDPRATVGTVHDPTGVDGHLVVGADHIVIGRASAGEMVVPLAGVAWVAPCRSG